ncbi:hypothetical protein [Thiomonas sp. X19]|nr:hypothetical protein [Thiomonas sp. X19]
MIATLIKTIGGLLIIAGISLAIHELNQMMDASNPVTSGVVLAPISAR